MAPIFKSISLGFLFLSRFLAIVSSHPTRGDFDVSIQDFSVANNWDEPSTITARGAPYDEGVQDYLGTKISARIKNYCTNHTFPHFVCRAYVPIQVTLASLATTKAEFGPEVHINVTYTNLSKLPMHILLRDDPLSANYHGFDFSSASDGEILLLRKDIDRISHREKKLPPVLYETRIPVALNSSTGDNLLKGKFGRTSEAMIYLDGGRSTSRVIDVRHNREIVFKSGVWNVRAKAAWGAVWVGKLKKKQTALEAKMARRADTQSNIIQIDIPKEYLNDTA